MLFDMEEWYIADGDSLEILIAAQAHVIHVLLLKDMIPSETMRLQEKREHIIWIKDNMVYGTRGWKKIV